jgi:protein-S-isoprenylcysteine O-methyltransferase Ste14
MLATVFDVIYVVGFVIGCILRAVHTKRSRRSGAARELPAGLDAALIALISVGMFVLPFLYLLSPWLAFADYELPPALGMAGIVVFAAALWLLHRSHVDLGEHWRLTPEPRAETTFVMHGIYSFVRHPMYLAHILWGLGQALLLQNWAAGWSFFVLQIPFYLYRVPREERLLTERFGDAYRAYRKTTGGFFPRLSRSKSSA